MQFTWYRKRQTKAKKGRRWTKVNAHYLTHKELAREVVYKRLAELNVYYGFSYNRVAIRNQSTRWGSCSTKGNLNFNYRLIFLPQHLMDYIIVHELCHLKHFNHSRVFWKLVAETIPEYSNHKQELNEISRNMQSYLKGKSVPTPTVS